MKKCAFRQKCARKHGGMRWTGLMGQGKKAEKKEGNNVLVSVGNKVLILGKKVSQKNLLRMNIPIDRIIEATGLTHEELSSL